MLTNDNLAELQTRLEIILDSDSTASKLFYALLAERTAYINKFAELEAREIDSLLEGAYSGGKLIRGRTVDEAAFDAALAAAGGDKLTRDEQLALYRKHERLIPAPQEARLRRIAERDGVDALRNELEGMLRQVPIGRRVVNPGDPQPPKTSPHPMAQPNGFGDALNNVAAMMGLNPADVAAQAAEVQVERGGRK